MIIIYRLLINFILIFSPLIILFRLLKKKEHPLRFREKFTLFSHKRKGGKLIWFHGASVGEILSVVPLIEKFEKNKNINQILVTSSTLSSSKIFDRYNFKKTIHQFFPIDTNFFSKRFLSYWKPNLAIFIDSEIWPNMLTNLKKKSITHILLNARITKKSFKRWKKLGLFSKKLFNNFTATYPQNLETIKYLKQLNAKKIKKLGNLKFSQNSYDSRITINKKLKKFLKDKKYWCATSTHEGEELICANTHLKLQKKYKNLITIIIPRHVQRTAQLENDFQKMNLKTHIHSSKNIIDRRTQIYIVDTYGETKLFFKICKVIFLGKSLSSMGGQNPLEPARYGCKVMHGPYVSNFKEIYKLLDKNNISFKVNNANQLLNKIDNLLKKNIRSKDMKNKINILGDLILKKTLEELKSFL